MNHAQSLLIASLGCAAALVPAWLQTPEASVAKTGPLPTIVNRGDDDGNSATHMAWIPTLVADLGIDGPIPLYQPVTPELSVPEPIPANVTVEIDRVPTAFRVDPPEAPTSVADLKIANDDLGESAQVPAVPKIQRVSVYARDGFDQNARSTLVAAEPEPLSPAFKNSTTPIESAASTPPKLAASATSSTNKVSTTKAADSTAAIPYVEIDEASAAASSGAISTNDTRVETEQDEASVPVIADAIAHTWSPPEEGLATLNPMLWIHRFTTDDNFAAHVQQKWADLPQEKRVLLIFTDGYTHDYSLRHPINELVKNGLDFGEFRPVWESLLDQLVELDLAPGRVVMGYEGGFTTFHLSAALGHHDLIPARLKQVWDDPEAFALLPAELQAIDPMAVSWFRDRQVVTRWNHFVIDIRNQSLIRDFAEPLHARFPGTPITNFSDMAYVEPMYDQNNWRLPEMQMGEEASPVIYGDDVEWSLEIIRQARDATGRPPVPWIAYPTHRSNFGAFEQIVRGAYALGVREFLYFNPDTLDKQLHEDSFTNEVLSSLNLRTLASYD